MVRGMASNLFFGVARRLFPCGLALLLLAGGAQSAPYPEWKYSGTLYILTTPEGADLPPAAVVEEFPLLVRLHKDWFDFAQAKPAGEDVRFSGSTGAPLAYQLEEWDPANGTASLWVRIPRIEGNARQPIRMHWGRTEAADESNGKAVFNESNGYLSVWHMGDEVRDEVGTLTSKDVETTVTAGRVGKARHLAGKQGIFCGDKIPNYPAADGAHSTEAWFRADRPNTTLIGWGNEGGGRGSKVRMQLRSPPHLRIDSDFSDVKGGRRLPMGEWVHVVHTYGRDDGRIYINGELDGASKPRLDIKRPARLWIGGWYHNYDFVGDVDEVRVSKVARSADWVRLQFENQKPLQTLVGPAVPPGAEFSVSPPSLTVREGESVTCTARAGGAQKVCWTLLRDGRETVVAVDRFAFTFEAGRVKGDTAATLRFKAVYPDGVKTKDIPIAIREHIEDPVFTLRAPAAWDGRSTIEIVPQVAGGAGGLKMEWEVSPFAVIKEIAPGRLILKRAQNSGTLRVTATAGNGGTPTSQTAVLTVTEPERDAWVARTPAKIEMPEEGQFYARDDRNEGTLFCNGTLAEPADSVFLRVQADGQTYASESAKPGADNSYSFAVKLKPGLVKYRAEFGVRETVLHTADNLMCGDAYVLNGQSNAVATDWGKEPPPAFRSEWIRTFGSMSGSPKGVRLWGEATHRSRDGGKLQVGYWAMELGRRLVESQKVPICIINGAVGGTRIDQHQRNPENPEDMTTLYGRLLWRVREARLTHGIRGVLWHQGENDQGADGPMGGFGWETYRNFFIELAAAWKQDFPNLQHTHVFQIWPKACSMGINGSDNRLREVQRTLRSAFSRLSIMSTLGIEPPGTCHYPPGGYSEIARLIFPVIERDHYGVQFPAPVTPPDLRSARFTRGAKDEIAMEFDQPVQWDDSLVSEFSLDGEKGKVASGRTAGNVVTLRLTAPSAAKSLTYLDSASWSQKRLLRGANGIAALTFCEVPILAAEPGR